MTIGFLRGRNGRRAAKPPAAEFAIDDDAPQALSCPACGRPLDRSIGRCPGCGTRLLLGVQARRAGVFTAFGVVVGALVGGMVVGMVASAQRPVPITAAAHGQTAAGPAQTPDGTGAGTIIPTAAKSALSQSAVINGRLVISLGELQAVLGARSFDTFATASELRALAADAAVGAGIAPQLAQWPAASQLGRDLAAFYASIRAAAHEGLASTLADAAAYRAAAKSMIAAFGRLAALDAATRQLAAQAGITVVSATP